MESSELEGFSIAEAETIQRIYVCAQCEGELTIIPDEWTIPHEENVKFHVVCPDCGFIEQIGRISKTTVAIRNEQAIHGYYRALKALPNLWGELLEVYRSKLYPVQPKPGETRREANLRELGF